MPRPSFRLPRFVFLSFVLGLLAPAAMAAPRDVQMRAFDFATSTMEIRNFGSTSEDLSGWRFCSHDEDQIRRYSAPSGLNGVTLAAGASIFVHFLNDAPGGDPSRIDVSSLGSFALPFDTGAYGIQLYFAPVSFGNGNTIADHAQWSIGGVDDVSADERSDEAETGGVWTDQSQWISTQADTLSIALTPAAEGLVLHSPASYDVNNPAAAVPTNGRVGLLVLAVVLLGIGLLAGARMEARA